MFYYVLNYDFFTDRPSVDEAFLH